MWGSVSAICDEWERTRRNSVRQSTAPMKDEGRATVVLVPRYYEVYSGLVSCCSNLFLDYNIIRLSSTKDFAFAMQRFAKYMTS